MVVKPAPIALTAQTVRPNGRTVQGRLIFHMFGVLAEFECSLIREHTQPGLAAVRRNPVGSFVAALTRSKKDPTTWARRRVISI